MISRYPKLMVINFAFWIKYRTKKKPWAECLPTVYESKYSKINPWADSYTRKKNKNKSAARIDCFSS